MDQYKPHPSAAFEGHYSKFDLPSGARLALIICTVPSAPRKPHMISFTYVPKDTSQVYQREIWVSELSFTSTSSSSSSARTGPPIQWRQDFPGGQVICHDDDTTSYHLDNEHFTFNAKTKSRTSWMPHMSTPEGLLVHLPLPLHWHVHSLASNVDFSLSIKDYDLPAADQKGTCTVHLEKNWANSFPSAHIWVQARKDNSSDDNDTQDTTTTSSNSSSSSICIAGGQILGLTAYLLGYRSSNRIGGGKWTTEFRPPFAVSLAGFSPTMTVSPNWATRTFDLSIQSWWRKIVVHATAPPGTFFGLSSPFPEGHRENFLGQSFEAEVKVEVFEAEGWVFGGWKKMHEEVFERGSLEFGGAYYGEAGGDKRRN